MLKVDQSSLEQVLSCIFCVCMICVNLEMQHIFFVENDNALTIACSNQELEKRQSSLNK